MGLKDVKNLPDLVEISDSDTWGNVNEQLKRTPEVSRPS